MLSAFRNNKSDLVEFVKEVLDYFTGVGKPVENIRLDNAGENIAVANLCKLRNINVEHTPPATPKLNGVVEQGFATQWNMTKIMLQNAGLKENVKRNKKILVEAIQTALFLYEESPQKGKQKSPNKLFFNKKKDRVQVKHFMEWGRFGFIIRKRFSLKINLFVF